MSEFLRIALCQIPLKLTRYPIRIANVAEHIDTVSKCFRYCSENHARYIVFPEYAYTPELNDLYKTYSNSLVIIGGSYHSEDNFNKAIFAQDGNAQFIEKMHLSPYQTSVIPTEQITPGEPNPRLIVDKHSHNVSILTCLDYYVESRKVALEKAPDGNSVDLIFSPSCNENTALFFREADATHDRRDDFYSIICNVSELEMNGSKIVGPWGKSCVFGCYDPLAREAIIGKDWCNPHYKSLILSIPDGANIGLIDIEVPFQFKRRTVLGYTKSPSFVDVMPINSI